MKILLADDSVTAQNMGKKILAEAGHEVVCVSNGAAALKKVAEQEPELVILDIYMPGYSGLEVCQRLKEGKSTADLPVVLTVGKLEPFRKEDAQRVRAEALIVKPFEASELAAAVARFAEIVASRPSKPKSKGSKLGPQPKAKPHWEEVPEEEFVTTSKLQEQAEEASFGEISPAASKQPESSEPPAVAAGEFEVMPQSTAAASDFAASSSEITAEAGAEKIESTEPEGASEFGVTISPAEKAESRPTIAARAAAAGADARSSESGPPLPQSFAVNPPVEAAVPNSEPSAGSLSPEAWSPPPAATEMSAAAEPAVVPSIDPAFDPDRTRWATEYATHFGVAEKTVEPAEPAASLEPEPPAAGEAVPEPPASGEAVPEPPACEQTKIEVSAASADEITAILSRLPGGMPEQSQAAEPAAEFGQPWGPSEVSAEAWKAEEVPVEDHDSSISLAEEMERAFGVAEPQMPSEVAEEEKAGEPERETAVANVEKREPEASPVPAPAAEEVSAPGSEIALSVNQPGEPSAAEPGAAVTSAEIKPTTAEADRIAGVMQSAAMAIATRATVSAVASQLHTPPAAEGTESATGPSAIEELVAQVLERLKPKLIAEVKRELGTTEDKQ